MAECRIVVTHDILCIYIQLLSGEIGIVHDMIMSGAGLLRMKVTARLIPMQAMHSQLFIVVH